MYLGIDIGGSKTLLARFDDQGVLLAKEKFPTPPDYDQFLAELGQKLQAFLTEPASAVGVAVPGLLDRSKGLIKSMGNLEWHDKLIGQDIGKLLGNLPIMLENDAKTAALHESELIMNDYKKVVYLTVSTGIGAGVTINGKLDPGMIDCEVGFMLLPYNGKWMRWEDFASGQAIREQTGKLASEIEEGSELWQTISNNLAIGIFNMCTVIQPEAIIIGGGVGTHLPKFQATLEAAVAALALPIVPAPKILQAKHPEEAVIYGCYKLARQAHENTAH